MRSSTGLRVDGRPSFHDRARKGRQFKKGIIERKKPPGLSSRGVWRELIPAPNRSTWTQLGRDVLTGRPHDSTAREGEKA
jgi:hypothetical protein